MLVDMRDTAAIPPSAAAVDCGDSLNWFQGLDMIASVVDLGAYENGRHDSFGEPKYLAVYAVQHE
jgi:hypothetical protein